MTELVAVFARAWAIVTLVALNTTHIAQRRYWAATLTGLGISWLWWANAHSAADPVSPWAGVAYTLGGSLGTLTGMAIGYWRRP